MAESPVGVFPDLGVQWDIAYDERNQTEIVTSLNGREQRRANFPLGGYRLFSFTSPALIEADRRTLHDFLYTQQGRLHAFYFFRPDSTSFTDYSCGSITAQTTVTLPAKAVTLGTVKVGGVAKAGSINVGAGPNGEDTFTFSGGAQTGAVTYTPTAARERVVCRLDSDDAAQAWVPNSSENRSLFRITLKEVL
jgi:hypothetical protein